MAKRRLTTAQILAQIPGAKVRAERHRSRGLHATAVRYDHRSQRFLMELSNGGLIGVPLASLRRLAEATPTQLANVALSASGSVLRVDAFDADYSVPGLILATVGRKTAARELARAGGQATSAAKARAARVNGAKGGRPRRVAAARK